MSAAGERGGAGAILWTLANGLMLLAFLFSVAVQLNDPDPLLWVTIYGAAAVACLLSLLHRDRWQLPALIALIAAVWAGTLAPHVLGKVRFLDMFGAFEMKNLGIEESREMYGLLFIAIWMVALVMVGRRRGVRGAVAPSSS